MFYFQDRTSDSFPFTPATPCVIDIFTSIDVESVTINSVFVLETITHMIFFAER